MFNNRENRGKDLTMSDVIRLNSPIFPDGLSVGVSSDRSIAVIDFLSKKNISENGETESVFAVALTKQHLMALKEALEKMENDES